MKTIKALLAYICYFGAGVAIIDKYVDLEGMSVPDPAKEIIIYLLIVFWCIKIAWFVWDRFYMQTRERNWKMERERGENSPQSMPYDDKLSNDDEMSL